MKTSNSASNLAFYFTGKIERVKKDLPCSITVELTNFFCYLLLTSNYLRANFPLVHWPSSSPIQGLSSHDYSLFPMHHKLPIPFLAELCLENQTFHIVILKTNKNFLLTFHFFPGPSASFYNKILKRLFKDSVSSSSSHSPWRPFQLKHF